MTKVVYDADQAGYSNTGGSPLPRKRAPQTKIVFRMASSALTNLF